MEMEGRKKQRNLHVTDDIIFNILRRFPPKSLASKTIQSIEFEADEIKAVDLDIPFKVGNRMLEIASSNGLLFILIEREGLVIWNPLIGRYKRFGVLVNEALYWKIICINNDKEVIPAVLCFDTLNEKFDVIPSPDNVHAYDLGVFKGHLCLFDHHEAGHIDMWTREVGKNQNWIKFMNLQRFDIKKPYDHVAPICSMKEEETLAGGVGKLFIPLSEQIEEFFLYSPEAKAYKKFHITMKDFIKEITYIDSFVSP
ncbi:hypothetical protein LWI28_007590 [Acer negundo]|uniref:F-box associated beta-propeller type 3 domain-containing protein n=1 Tax=Acer negundo TaxID=4023 RepID=A0AAD5J3G0_ACENE|nr:hypothetical protein LWI28_007590 [Acer negundo]